MNQTVEIINLVLPILLLISLGAWVRYKQFLTANTIEELRKIIVNFALPAVLFISFLNIELKSSYFLIFAFMFLLCISLFLLGVLIKKFFRIEHEYFPFLITGFEYGMLGISLYGAAYGLDNIGYIAITDLGHEIFIWFVFLPLLLIKRDGSQNPKAVAKSFLSSPVVIAILTGIAFNLLGAHDLLYQLPLTGGLMITFSFLGALTVPLILIIVGYGIKIDRRGLKEALVVVLIRFAVLLSLVFLVNVFMIRGYLHLGRLFEAAVFTLLVLPPPFIVPLYTPPDLAREEKEYINNVLTVSTVISVTLFLIYFALNPML
jgi:predicted permease